MIPYILLVLIPVLMSFAAAGDGIGGRKIIRIGKSEYIEKNNLAFSAFFFLYFLMLALKDICIGNDTLNYQSFFESYNDPDIAIVRRIGFEQLYGLFSWFFHRISHSFQLFLVAVAAFCVLPMAKLYNEYRKNSILQIAIFINLSTFVMLFSGLRQAMAMAVGVAAYKFVREKKLFWFIVTCFIALGFHHSAFILFLMYPLYHISFKKRDLWFIVPAIAAVFIFNEQIITFVARAASLLSDKYEDFTIEHTGAITTFIMFAVFAVFCYLIPDESKMDKEMLGLRNILLFSVVLQSFASLHTLAMRMNYYYMIFIPIIVAKVIEVPKERYRQIAKIGGTAITLFLLVYFFMGIYRDYVTGESALNTVPYVFFWES